MVANLPAPAPLSGRRLHAPDYSLWQASPSLSMK